MLAWFVLSISVAVASPWANPQAVELICTGSGVFKLLVKSDDGALEHSVHTLECPLCLQAGAPPPLRAGLQVLPRSRDHGKLLLAANRVAVRTAAPLPPRGPPPVA